jgi:hypothetical protein
MYIPTNLHDTILNTITGEVNIRKRLLRHATQRLGGPLSEPVNSTARNQRREVSESVPEGVSNGREREYEVKVRLHATQKLLVHVLFGWVDAFGLADGTDGHEYLVGV